MADPICRWRNATPETVCEIVEELPKNEMPEDEFRDLMTKSKFGSDFFRTPYQGAPAKLRSGGFRTPRSPPF